jgi:putative endonuclease
MSENENGDAAANAQGAGLGGMDPVLHCCACSRIFSLPTGAGVGAIVDCPFCFTKRVLRTMTVYVSDPVVAAWAMADHRRDVGAAGEEQAVKYLQRLGLKLLHRNLRIGRLGELDIVMAEKDILVFVEVKSKLVGDLGGRDNVTWTKQRKLVDLATAYLQQHGMGNCRGARFDVVEVVYPDASLQKGSLTHLRDAFRA